MVYPKTGSVIVRHGREMTYTHIQANQTPSRSVCFFFPGASYSFDRPYLYYSTMLFLSKQVDLIHVHAEYGKGIPDFETSSFAKRSAWISEDMQTVVSQVLDQQVYERVFFLGKSLGTVPIACSLLKEPRFCRSSAILLTPLLREDLVVADLLALEQNVFLVSGTADPHYHQPAIERIMTSKPNIHRYLPQNAKHSLDIGLQVDLSLQVLQSIMEELGCFLDKSLDICSTN
ncbi:MULTISPECIES: alpha/beta hydrolase [Brevibacillus]|uniref:Alpha/beta hydrolase n=1 Tax=Brevibacillus brevis TaxID=1393 RepID=A0A2Z4MFF1_BREBE|nr:MULTISPECIES: alpha/beta hydrolase [Brevibacillus]AWX55267.1 alpha/beta hydrolase [Brevibacillus brevis]NRR23171.1 alpha/beta hydrolase [Brevibacillus sp. MS2.2]